MGFRDATKNSAPIVLLALAASPVATSAVISESGAVTQTYVKDLIRVGEWVMPQSGVKFSVTNEDLDHWVKTFETMQAAGVKVHVPSGHTDDADKNRGWVLAMFRDGDVLKGQLKIIGEDAIAAAVRNEVSIYVPPTLTDGKGNTYERPIAHVALTPTPVISGQGGWVPIAASNTQHNTRAALALSREDYVRLSAVQGVMHMKTIADKLGIKYEGMDDAAIEAAILAKIDEMSKTVESSNTKVEAAKVEASTATAALAASRGQTHDPVVLSLAAENRGMKIDALVTSGKITPAVAAGLKAAYVSGDSLKLSLAPDANATFGKVIEALGKNDVKVLGEQTASQTLALSRNTPGDQPTALSKEEIDAAAKRAYGVRK